MKHLKTISVEPRPAQQARNAFYDLVVNLLVQFEVVKTRKATGM